MLRMVDVEFIKLRHAHDGWSIRELVIQVTSRGGFVGTPQQV